MQEARSEVLMEELLQDINDSVIYSLMADESTDVSAEKPLVIYACLMLKMVCQKLNFLK
jgi:hypothetical protein